MKKKYIKIFLLGGLCVVYSTCFYQSTLWALEDMETAAVQKKLDTIIDKQKEISGQINQIQEKLRIIKIRVTRQ